MFFFFFNDTATTEIYTLSLHDALPISARRPCREEEVAALEGPAPRSRPGAARRLAHGGRLVAKELQGDLRTLDRSEEHTSELQSRQYLVCRLLLEKKKKEK